MNVRYYVYTYRTSVLNVRDGVMMAKKIPIETEEEFQFVREFVLLPLTLDVLERDIKMLETVPLKMPNIYIQMLQGIQNLVTVDLVKVRRKLREHGMKVYEQRRTNMGVEATYLCRGYHHDFSMMWGVVRAEVEGKIRDYLHIEIASKGADR